MLSFVLARGHKLLRPALAVSFIWTGPCNSELPGAGGSGGESAISGGGGGVAASGAVPSSGGSVISGGVSSSGANSTGGAPSGGIPSTGGALDSDGSIARGGGGGFDAGVEGGLARGGIGGVATADSGTNGVAGSGCADPTAPTSCGNGTIEPGEQCDGANLRRLTCHDVDPIFSGGVLECQPVVCLWNAVHCLTNETCGNGVLDPGEDCEPTLFYAEGNHFCSDYLPGSDGALVECSPATCKYWFSNCAGGPAPVCGDGIVEGGEQCDGADRRFRTCTEAYVGFTDGALGCNQQTCQLDYSQCERCNGTRCGDGIIQSADGEECDGTPTMTCADANRLFGTVSCTGMCRNDTSQCTGGCTYTPYGWICS